MVQEHLVVVRCRRGSQRRQNRRTPTGNKITESHICLYWCPCPHASCEFLPCCLLRWEFRECPEADVFLNTNQRPICINLILTELPVPLHCFPSFLVDPPRLITCL